MERAPRADGMMHPYFAISVAVADGAGATVAVNGHGLADIVQSGRLTFTVATSGGAVSTVAVIVTVFPRSPLAGL